ncbi:MAG: trypsin-like peptidase domain-containing protein [Betaproteobacteria bacterium]
MKRPSVYSGRTRTRNGAAAGPPATARQPGANGQAASAPPPEGKFGARLRRHERPLLFVAGLLGAALIGALFWARQPETREFTQEDIDAAVMHTIETKALPSQAARAAESVRQSVVRVNGYTDVPEDAEDDNDKEAKSGGGDHKDRKNGEGQDSSGAKKNQKPEADAGSATSRKSEKADKGDKGVKVREGNDGDGPGGKGSKAAKGGASGKDAKSAKNAKDKKDSKESEPIEVIKPGESDSPKLVERRTRVGTGVVIIDNGTILTNLHVVAGAKRVTVTFSDGMESEAVFVGAQPENDLAVIRAKQIPDDLPAATLGASNNLQPGDEVVAVGFPFGIGPSISAGVVSGLNREFRSPQGKRKLTRLIQFDAAVNPGNSGGPLVNMSGEVVGIVTALLNPTEHRTFIGIGFAATIESAGSAVGVPPF